MKYYCVELVCVAIIVVCSILFVYGVVDYSSMIMDDHYSQIGAVK